MALLLVTYQNLDGGTVSPQILFSPRIERLVSCSEEDKVMSSALLPEDDSSVSVFVSFHGSTYASVKVLYNYFACCFCRTLLGII